MIPSILLLALLVQDDSGKALRDAAAKVVTASKVVSSSSDPKSFDRTVEDFLKLYYGVGQKEEVRSAVKAEIVAALKAARARAIKAAQDRATSNAPWRKLIALKTELEKRREEALKVIRDES